jgi:hypothetical protein
LFTQTREWPRRERRWGGKTEKGEKVKLVNKDPQAAAGELSKSIGKGKQQGRSRAAPGRVREAYT